MSSIDVTALGDDRYRVEVTDGGGVSRHEVTASAADVERLGGGTAAERLISASFAFLLEREPKESILSRFDLPVIGRYFPEYEKEIRSRLDA
jgi:hypothetical protein